ncbi:class B sortase [Anaerolentibacter hominis]|uniref:class B sortase n=1 Tax=Anaerolentibacter hominis TaxID=3079009 RepID=UPI0031B847E3
MKHKKTKNLIINLSMAVLLVIFLFSAARLIRYHQEAKKNSNIYEELVSETVRVPEQMPMLQEENEPVREEQTDEHWSPRYIDFDKLALINDEIIGWITAEGTSVDYPVVQTDNNEFYLNHDINKNVSSYGAIFADADAELSGNPFNTVLYGHHMKNGQMFGELKKYREPEFRERYPYFTYTDQSGSRKFEIFAVCVTDANENGRNFLPYHRYTGGSEEENEEFLGKVHELALYETGVEAAGNDQIMILSTCTYEVENGRMFVVGKLVDTAAK